ncbi:hypothetical protein [Streptomyces iakyrus]|uniref:hypothetical protein n=1 Tax=Streptomyces iakyrus TaxID=68219 RepID=UPI003D922617
MAVSANHPNQRQQHTSCAVQLSRRVGRRTSGTSCWSRCSARTRPLERIQQRLLGGRSEEAYFAEAERIGPYLALLRGVSYERETLQWGDMALRRLDQRAKTITQKIDYSGGSSGDRNKEPAAHVRH